MNLNAGSLLVSSKKKVHELSCQSDGNKNRVGKHDKIMQNVNTTSVR